MEYHANPPNSAHASNAQSWNIRTHWEIESGWRGHLCIAKVKELKSGRADMRCRSGQDVPTAGHQSSLPAMPRFIFPKFPQRTLRGNQSLFCNLSLSPRGNSPTSKRLDHAVKSTSWDQAHECRHGPTPFRSSKKK